MDEKLKIRTSQNVPVENGGMLPSSPDPVSERYKQDIDRASLRENMKLTVEQRFQKLKSLQRFALELRKAGRQAVHDRL